MIRKFLSTGWGAVATTIAALGMLATIGPSIAALRPWLPAPIFYVDQVSKVSDDTLAARLSPIRREQLEQKIDRIDDRTLDLEGDKVQFDSLKTKAETDAEREAIEDQIREFQKRLDQLSRDRRDAACELDILMGKDKCE